MTKQQLELHLKKVEVYRDQLKKENDTLKGVLLTVINNQWYRKRFPATVLAVESIIAYPKTFEKLSDQIDATSGRIKGGRKTMTILGRGMSEAAKARDIEESDREYIKRKQERALLRNMGLPTGHLRGPIVQIDTKPGRIPDSTGGFGSSKTGGGIVRKLTAKEKRKQAFATQAHPIQQKR